MNTMETSTSPIRADRVRPLAQKAVQGYLHHQFPKFFSAEEKEDLVSEVVLRIWRSREAYDPSRGSVSTWVGTMAKNAVLTAALSKSNRSEISGSLEDLSIPLDESEYGMYRSGQMSADGEFLAEELLEGFRSRLSSDRERRFLSWQVEGLSAKEMAQREGIPAGATHTALCRLRRKLRDAA